MNENKSFACRYNHCTKSYSTKYSLQRHCSIRHNKSKRFTCRYCKRILSSNQNLKEHLFTHSNEKPLKCPYFGCFKEFRQSSQMSSHKKVHVLASKKSTNHCVHIEALKVKNKQLTELLRSYERIGVNDSQEFMNCQDSLNIPVIFSPRQLELILAQFKNYLNWKEWLLLNKVIVNTKERIKLLMSKLCTCRFKRLK